MKEEICRKLEGRENLIQKLSNQYINRNAPEMTIVVGNHGSGKSFVLFETLNKILAKKNTSNKMQIYIPDDDKLSLYRTSESVSLDNIEPSISLPFRWGVGLNIATSFSKNGDSQFNHICNLLNRRLKNDILICIPKYSEQNYKIKLLVELLILNVKQLERTFRHKLYFLISDLTEANVNELMGCSSILKIQLEDYDEEDIYKYIIDKHNIVLERDCIWEKLKQIKKICASNLKLIDFLYVDLVERDLGFFRALDTVVSYRLQQLKADGQKRNINEYDMEDIILTSSISLKSFGGYEISEVSKKELAIVRDSLNLAKKQELLERNSSGFYSFISDEIQMVFKKELENWNRERYLDYYNYYCEHEQDQYYLRAYYLWMYTGKMQDNIFALLMLAYSEAQNFNNTSQIKQIELILNKANSYYLSDYNKISEFYLKLSQLETDFNELDKLYSEIQRDYYELPLKAELARAYFHFMYKNYAPWDSTLNRILNQLTQYVKEDIAIDVRNYPGEILKIDETVIRLRIIYDITPCILDTMNNVTQFKKLYDLSICLSQNLKTSQFGKGISQYMENVFNRKAFLFVNQTQCNIYYDKAKRYFYTNQIWDEYCITLICEAGTDIVIQKYDDAIACCRKAKEYALKYDIIIPQPQKMMNNALIATFFRYERNHSADKCFRYARKIARKLQKQLQRKPCATEFVILTNICSLLLYSGDISEYYKYKRYFEKLMGCNDISDIEDEEIDDFYRYYFAWFEVYRCIRTKKWDEAQKISEALDGFVPALFQKQEVFWDKKLLALKEIIRNRKTINGYNFSRNLVALNRRANELATFFCRGLMLSDLQYTSYD